jgi:serine/arginine repetitive matrix protein 1
MPDPRKMQVNLLGFMDKYGAAHFTETLWNLLISAQNTVGGVPAEVSPFCPTGFYADITVY